MTVITLLLLIPTVGAIAVSGYATIDKGREERSPSPKRDGGASAKRSSSPRPSPSPAAPELAPCPRDPVPGPAATAAALLFLPPALSLVHPTLYLPASIPVLLTPARNSASLPAPPRSPPDGDNDANDDQRSVNATMDPSPEYYRPRATQSTSSSSTPPTTGGRRGAEHSALSLLGSRSQSVRYYLRTIIPRRRHRQRAIGGAEAEVVVVAGRGSSGRRGSGGGDNRVMFCVVLRSRLELLCVC